MHRPLRCTYFSAIIQSISSFMCLLYLFPFVAIQQNTILSYITTNILFRFFSCLQLVVVVDSHTVESIILYAKISRLSSCLTIAVMASIACKIIDVMLGLLSRMGCFYCEFVWSVLNDFYTNDIIFYNRKFCLK